MNIIGVVAVNEGVVSFPALAGGDTSAIQAQYDAGAGFPEAVAAAHAEEAAKVQAQVASIEADLVTQTARRVEAERMAAINDEFRVTGTEELQRLRAKVIELTARIAELEAAATLASAEIARQAVKIADLEKAAAKAAAGAAATIASQAAQIADLEKAAISITPGSKA